jgi:diguanylate cyclase (GGDEF)-like protein
MTKFSKLRQAATGNPAAPEIQHEMLLRSAEQIANVVKAAPFFALLILVALRDGQPRVIELIWCVGASVSGTIVAWWFRSRLKKDPDAMTCTVYRLGVGAVTLFASIVPLIFRPRLSASGATLEIVVAITSIIVLQTLTAADRKFSYCLLAVMIAFSVPGLDVIRFIPRVLIFLDSLMIFLVFAPLIEAIHRPLRESIELAFTNKNLVCELKEVNHALSTQVVTDPLTGLVNRSGLDRALGEPRAVGVLYIDVDAFKTVNDRFGHATGDDVLRRIAAILRHVAREKDVVCRLAGDEFVMLLDRAPQPVVEEVAERIRECVDREFAGEGISVSIGGTLGDLRNEAPGGILSRADANLYIAKETGRNRAVVRF